MLVEGGSGHWSLLIKGAIHQWRRVGVVLGQQTMWHVVITIDVARGAGIQVVVLGDVAMALGPGSSSLGC